MTDLEKVRAGIVWDILVFHCFRVEKGNDAINMTVSNNPLRRGEWEVSVQHNGESPKSIINTTLTEALQTAEVFALNWLKE